MQTLWQLDESGMHLINQGLSSPFFDAFFWVFTCLGLGWLQALPFVVSLFFQKVRAIGAMGLIAIAFSGLLCQLIKKLIPRMRPPNWPETVRMKDEVLFSSSFVSGHTTTAFAIATLLTLIVPNERRLIVGSLSFLVASLVGISRIYRGVHWPTDVVAGAMLGIASGCFIVMIYNRKMK